MGRHYEEPFRRLVDDLNPSRVAAFIDVDNIDPKYQQHIVRTLTELGARTVDSADAATLVIQGYVDRVSDGAVGLAIQSDSLGAISLFPDGYEISRVRVAI